MFTKLQFSFLALLLVIIASSCTKTIDPPLHDEPKILSFKVTNTNEGSLYGAIDHIEKSISVYLPFYYGLQAIEPEIKVSDDAILKEADQEGNLLPVLVSDSISTYTIVSKKNGTEVQYKLKILVQIPDISVEEYSTADDTASFEAGDMSFYFSGDFKTKDLSLIKAYLVADKSGKEYPVFYSDYTNIIKSSTNPNGIQQKYINSAGIPLDIDTGLFKLKVRMYNKEVVTKYPIRINYAQPSFNFIFQTLKQGETFTLRSITGLRGFKSLSVLVGDMYIPLEIEQKSLIEATVRIPDDFPPGVYYSIKGEFEDWPDFISSNYLTIEVK